MSPDPAANDPPPRPARSRPAWLWSGVAITLSLLLSAALTWSAWNGAQTRDRARFETGVNRTHTAIAARLELYIGMLRAGVGLVAAEENLTPGAFRAFAERVDLPANYPGVQGIGFARRVSREERAAYVAHLRRELGPGFEITPSGERDEYFPIVFLEPRDRRNQHAVGYDMFSEATRRDAMSRARDEGRPAATRRVVLVQEIDPEKQAGFLIYAPAYRGGRRPVSVDERREALLGFVYSPFRAGDLFSGLLGDPNPGLSFEIYDGGRPESSGLLYRSPLESETPPRFTRTLPLRVADRDWTVVHRSTPAFDARSARGIALWIAFAGAGASAAMGVIVFALANAVTHAQDRERELARQKERLRVTLASIGDAVVCTDGAGKVDFLNPVAETLTGWTLEEARGRPLPDIAPLVNEDTRLPLRNPAEMVLRTGETLALANHTILVSRRGGDIPVEDSAAPIRAEDGAVTGVVLVFHDVAAKRRAEAALRQRERLLAAVASGAAVGLAIIRKNGDYAFANETFARAFAAPEHLVVGRSAAAVAGPAWEDMRPAVALALAGNPGANEIVLHAADPRGRRYAVSYEPQGQDEERGVVVVMLDITERKRAEEELQVSEERHRLAVEAGELGTWDYYPGSRRLIWDARCRHLLGVPPEAPVDFELFLSLVHPGDRDRVSHVVAATLQPGGAGHCDIEYRVVRPRDRAERWIRATGKAYFDPGADGAARRFIGTVQDITEDKRKEDALHFLVDLSAATQALVDPEEILRTTARMLGEHLDVDRCAYAEVEDESVFIVTGDHPRGVSSIVGRWPVASFGAECARLMRANQPLIVVDAETDPRVGPEDLPAYRATEIRAVICVPLRKAGRFTAAMAVHQTRPRRWSPEEIYLVEMVVARCWESLERGRAIRGLQESERRLRFMAESIPQKIFTARPDGGIDYLNRQWVEFAGVPLDQLGDWGWAGIVHPDDRAENLRRWRHSVVSGEPFQIEHRFRRHDGEYRWHLTQANPLRDREGKISMWIGSNTEITEMVKKRETLAERRRELERLVDERTASLRKAVEQMEEFSYSISHDLRAPLRAMQGYAQALLEDYGRGLDEEGRDYLRRIIAASSRMDRLTLDVLTYSKVSREDIRPQRVSLERLVTDCVRQHVDFRDGGADIVIEHPLPDVIGHEPLLMQVVSNLIGNALKFVAPGTQPRVRILAEREGDEVRVWIEDNGIGVPPRFQKKIWGMFERAHQAGGYAGTGIGLAIVRKAVERMGGRVGVESDGARGSRFWVNLPAAAPENPAASAPQALEARARSR